MLLPYCFILREDESKGGPFFFLSFSVLFFFPTHPINFASFKTKDRTVSLIALIAFRGVDDRLDLDLLRETQENKIVAFFFESFLSAKGIILIFASLSNSTLCIHSLCSIKKTWFLFSFFFFFPFWWVSSSLTMNMINSWLLHYVRSYQ